MGQMFHACAYDIETKTCCVMDADKFHARCYAHSETVLSMHYLLRQKPYRVMWCGDYALYGVYGDVLEYFSRTEDLLGVSTFCNYENFEFDDEDLQEKNYYDKVKFIDDNNKLWKNIDVSDEAAEYFSRRDIDSVRYTGYLVNHTQKLAVDLKDYFTQSFYLSRNGKYLLAADALPVLTETGGGVYMLFYEGLSVDSTEMLSGTWCGDLLQIIETFPKDYKIINCCFAEIWDRVEHCYYVFGIDKDGYVLNDSKGKRFEATRLDYHGKRGLSSYIKVELIEKKIKFIPVRVKECNA